MRKIQSLIMALSLLMLSSVPLSGQHFVPVYESVYQPMNIIINAATIDVMQQPLMALTLKPGMRSAFSIQFPAVNRSAWALLSLRGRLFPATHCRY